MTRRDGLTQGKLACLVLPDPVVEVSTKISVPGLDGSRDKYSYHEQGTVVLLLWPRNDTNVETWRDVRWAILTAQGTTGWVYGDELIPLTL